MYITSVVFLKERLLWKQPSVVFEKFFFCFLFVMFEKGHENRS